MHWKIIAIGKPALPWARDGIADYLQRLTRMARVEIEYLRDGTALEVEERLLRASTGCIRIVLDERGTTPGTQEMRAQVDAWELQGVKRVALLIGPANGHTPATRAAADCIWALSKLTLQHELALTVLLEQIYRVYTIKRGEPYHR